MDGLVFPEMPWLLYGGQGAPELWDAMQETGRRGREVGCGSSHSVTTLSASRSNSAVPAAPRRVWTADRHARTRSHERPRAAQPAVCPYRSPASRRPRADGCGLSRRSRGKSGERAAAAIGENGRPPSLRRRRGALWLDRPTRRRPQRRLPRSAGPPSHAHCGISKLRASCCSRATIDAARAKSISSCSTRRRRCWCSSRCGRARAVITVRRQRPSASPSSVAARSPPAICC